MRKDDTARCLATGSTVTGNRASPVEARFGVLGPIFASRRTADGTDEVQR
ncbi:hypothetical protein ABGB09_31295 [Streptomyces sp. B8F3]